MEKVYQKVNKLSSQSVLTFVNSYTSYIAFNNNMNGKKIGSGLWLTFRVIIWWCKIMHIDSTQFTKSRIRVYLCEAQY